MCNFNNIFSIIKGMRPDIPGDCPPLFAQLIRDCWDTDPQHRPSFLEILSRLRAMEAASVSSLSKSPPASPLGKSHHQVNTTTNNNNNEKKGWEIDAKEVEVTQLVKANAGSRVHRGKYRGHDVAIKELFRSSNEKKEIELKSEFLKEVEVMYSGTFFICLILLKLLLMLLIVRSSYVVFFYGAITNPRSLVIEWMDHSLYDLMTKEKGIYYMFLLLIIIISKSNSYYYQQEQHCQEIGN